MLGSSLGKYLKEYRFRMNETQNWLAEKLGFARITIIKWENKGAGTATLDQAEQIAEKLKVPISKLLGLEKSDGEDIDKVKSEWEALKAHLQSLPKPSPQQIPESIIELLSQLPEHERNTFFMMWEHELTTVLNRNKKGRSNAG